MYNRLQEMDIATSAYVVYDPSYEIEWTTAVSSVLGDHYEKVASQQLIGIFLIVYANKALIPAISSVQSSQLATGYFALFGNKGATAIRLQCYDSTICFVNVHLYHVADAPMRRTDEVRRILTELVFDNAEPTMAHDHVFFFGDLNYRVATHSAMADVGRC
jgi:synaptojanin